MGKIRNLLTELKNNAIDVVLTDGELEVFYDGEDLDPVSLKQIKENKDELIQFLKGFELDIEAYDPIPPVPSQENYPLSSSQYRLWIVSQLEGGNSAYNLVGDYEIEGLLDIELMESAFKFIIARHDSLRTAFKEVEQGEVRQYIIENKDVDFRIDYEDVRSVEGLDLDSVLKEQHHTPFDLEEGVLLKVKVFQTAESKCVLSLVMHHIISDGWSMEILIKELFTFYSSVALGQTYQFKPLHIQYKDYAVWQQEQLKGSQLEKHKSYWINQFIGEIPIINLPIQYQRPSIKTYNGKTLNKVLNKNGVQKLRDLSQSQGGTLFMGVLSLVKVLLHRYTQQEDIIIGSSLAGRQHSDLEGQVGFFVNTLPLRTNIEKEDNFINLLNKVKHVTLGAYQHHIYPLDELVNSLSIKRDQSRNALFDVMVDLQNSFDVGKEYDATQSIKTFNIKPYEVKNTISRFDLHFSFSEKPEELHLGITYNTDIFSNDFVVQMLNHLEQLLEEITVNPYVPTSQLKCLNDDEKHQLLMDFNDTEADYPKDKTIVEVFEEQVKKTPNNIAVVFEGTELTYQELNEKSNQLAYYLRENYSIKADDLVGIKLGRGETIIVAILGVLKSGAAYLPIDVNYPEERISYIEKDSQCKVVLDEEEMMLYNLERFRHSNENLIHINQPHDLAYIIYTSGSTGQPKGVMVEHTSNVNMSLAQIQSFNITESDKVVWFASVAFDASISEIMMCLYSGATLCIPTEETIKDKDEFVKFLKETKSSVVTLPPSYLGLLSEKDISGLRCLITAGESPNPGKALEVVKSGIDYYNAYGPTECAVCVSIYQLTENNVEKTFLPIGKPISNTQVYILDESLQPLPIGVTGKIYVSGAGLARGYLNKPELTAEKFITHPFIEGERMYDTGDLGTWLPDGNIEFMGRKDHQVKIRGFRIELGEIESVISQYSEDLKQVAVEAKEANGEKTLVAYFTSTDIIDKSELRSFLQGKLPDYMVPSFYVELGELPLTPNGKIDRKALPGVDGEDLIRNGYVAPGNETEEKLAAIWQEVLGVEKVGVTDSFFELGGHSLSVAQVINRTHKQFGKAITFKAFFANPTIEGLSKELYEAKYVSIPKAPETESYPLTASQGRLWIMSQLEGGSLAYNMPGAIRLKGVIDANKFEESFRSLIRRHEILRTCIKTNDEGDIRQYIIPIEQLDFKISREDYSFVENQEIVLASYIEEKSKEPFDLEQAPLVRGSLIKLKEKEYVFFLSMPHIVGDGWSMELLVSEVVKTYNALSQGKEVDLPELGIQYKDYAVWLNGELQQEKQQVSEQYWLQQFAGELPVLELPSFKTRPLVQTYNGANISHHFSQAFLGKLKDFSKAQDATLFMTLMAGVNVLLHKYSGQDDIIVGTPIAGREHPDLENQIGLYLNTLAIRTRFEEGNSFVDLVAAQKEILLAAYEHQSYPFDALVGKLDVKRDTSRSALFDVLVALQNQGQLSNLKGEELINLEISNYDFSNETAKFDISFNFFESEGLDLAVSYNTDIYDAYLIERMFVHLENLLTELVKQPEMLIREVGYLTAEEQSQLLLEFNDTEIDYPKDKTIIELFEEQVEKTPNNIAIVFEETELTYEELNEKSNQLANYLRENYSIKADDLVGIKLDRSDRMITAILGILKSGAAYVPIDVNYPQERINYIEKDSQCKAVLDEAELEIFAGVQDKYSKKNIEKITTSSDLAYVIYTSGTTGNPKGVMVEHMSLINRLEWMQKAYVLSDNDVILQKTSYSFDVSVWELFWWIYKGSKLCILKPEGQKDPKEIIYHIERYKISVLHFVPSMLSVFLDYLKENKLESGKLKSLKQVFVSGEALSADQNNKFFAQFPDVSLMNLYGPTEATIDVSYYECTKDEVLIPIGKPIDNIRLFILNNDLQIVPIGVAGKLYISGAGVARGYLNKPELTAEKFVSNPFIEGLRMYDTGDLSRWLPDGNIEFIGRKDHQVKIRGFRIELGEIESVILQYSEDLKQVVVEAKAVNEEKVLIAYFTSTDIIDKSELRSFLLGKLPDYMVPSFYVELDELPLTPNGKIDRKALPGVDGGDLIRNEYVAARNETEEKLVAIWQEVLGVERVGVTDNFFELGGHSLSVAQVINRIRKQFGKTITFKAFFLSPTIEGSGNELQENKYVSIPKAAEAESYPLTASQSRLWIMSQLEGGSLAYNMPAAIRLKGAINDNKFEESFRLLIYRHEILRTCIKTNDEGDIRQYIIPIEQLDFKISREDYSFVENQEVVLASYIEEKNKEPFDLEQAPLVRGSLIKLKEEEYVFFLSMPHIVGDGWSMELLVSEVVKTYNALSQGKAVDLPELGIQYKDYAVWLNGELQQEKQQVSEQYWLQQFAGELPVLELPSFKTRPLVQTYNGAIITHHFSQAFLGKLKDFSRAQDATLFMTLMAGVNVLLHKYSGQDDIIVGTPMAGREHPDLENQIGLYLNTLVIRTRFEEGNSFMDLVAAQKETLLSAYEHQSYPFDALVGKLDLKRDTSRSALFDVLVVLQNQGQLSNLKGEELINLEISNYNFSNKTAQFDITFTFVESEGLDLAVSYNTDIYDAYLIERMFVHFENLLTESLEQPAILIQEVGYLTAEEKNQLLLEFNDTEIDYPKDKTIIELFEEQVEKTPNNIAVAFGETELTYKEVNERANQLAGYLKSNHIINPDDLIAIKLERSEKLIVAMLGVLKSGAAYVPIDPRYPKERIAYIESNSNSIAVLDDNAIEIFDTVRDRFSRQNPEKKIHSGNLAYVIYTSGTTGNPKGVMVEHKNLTNFVFGMNDAIPLKENDHLLAITSVSFDISILELFWTLTKGIAVTIKSDSALNNFDTFVDDQSVTLDFSLFYFSSSESVSNDKYKFLKESASYADENEYSAIWLPERHFHEFGGIFPNPSVLGAGLATITNNLQIRSGSVVLPLHDPIRVAEEWSVVDNLSNGRVALSIASGWHADDFVLQPENYQTRHQIMYTQIEELKTLWKGSSVNRTNGMNREIEVKTYPRPVNTNLEIYITSGGNAETFRSAGKIGANILTHLLGQELKDLANNIQVYKEALLENGYSVESAKIALMLHTYVGTDLEVVKNKARDPFKSYLKSSVGLLQNLAKGLDKDVFSISESDLSDLLDLAFERYWQTAALLGTPDSCKKIVAQIHAIGITEIACLIDFGISDEDVINGLEHLTTLKDFYSKSKKEESVSLKKNVPITSLQITPSYLEALLEDETSHLFMKSLKNVIVGGEKFSNELLAKLRLQASSAAIYNMYGPTETTIWSTFQKAQNEVRLNIGNPIQNTQIYILDNNKQICPVGVKGELCIGGDGLSRGYYHEEKLTSEKFFEFEIDTNHKKRIYKTGDLARWLPNGTLEHLGRVDNQVKINGFRIELGEIESVLLRHEQINQVVVVAKENQSGASILVAYFIGFKKVNPAELKDFLEQILPGYMIPNSFIQLEELPLTPNGKIDRKALPDVDGKDLVRNEYVAPRNETEEKLVTIWQEVLGVERVGVTDNFFELGGHSLSVVQLINRINKQFGQTITFKAFFSSPTIERSSKELQENKYISIPKAPETESYPLTASQSRLWILSQLEGGSLAYNMPGAIRLKGGIDDNKLEESFRLLIYRHEVLRTCIKTNDEGDIRQYIIPTEQLDFKISREDYSFVENQEVAIASYIEEKSKEPFNLEQAPLVRGSLIKLKEEEYVFFLSMHHIVGDGWSMELLVSEVIRIYNTLAQGKEIDLPELSIHYKDYAVWLNGELQQEKQQLSEQYWLQQFAGELPVLEMPSFKTRPLFQTYNGANISHHFSQAFLGKLKDFSKEHDVTLFMTLMAGINVLLHKYSGQNDIIVGTPIAGREHQDLENQIGLYLNTLAIRTRFNEGNSFLDLVAAQKEILLGAYEHQSYPFDALVDKLNLQRDTSRSALFDVLVVLQNQGQLNNFNEEELVNLEVSNYNFPNKTAQFDLSFNFVESEGLDLDVSYNTDIYDAYLVERMFVHFENLLTESLGQPEALIREIEYLTEEEQNQLLVGFNETEVDYPIDKTIIDLFEEQAEKTPNNIAVAFEETELTYKELNEKSNQLANYLRENYSIKADDFVGIKLDRSERMITAILGILKSGAAYVPIDINYPEERIAYIEKDSQCKIVLDEAELKAFVEVQDKYSKENLEKSNNSHHLAYVIYTSGTTGNPKGVMVEHLSVVSISENWKKHYGLTQFEVNLLQLASISFDVFMGDVCRSILNGGKMIICSNDVKLNPENLFELIEKQKISILEGTPGLLLPLMKYIKSERKDYSFLKIVIFGSDIFNNQDYNRLKDEFGERIKIINSYGVTEATIDSTYYDNYKQEINGLTPIGKPFSNTQIYILDEGLDLLPIGGLGKIYISGAGLARGYLNKPELTQEKFVSNPFIQGGRMYDTGDLGRWLPDGNIEFMGRKDHQVKIRGFRIELGEIESVISQYSEDLKQVVVDAKEVNEEKTLVAYFTSTESIDKSELRNFLLGKLPDYMVPGFYVELDELPLTPNGKVDRKALPGVDGEDLIRNEYVAPGNETEEKLAEIWQEVLGVERVGVTDNFFELGGHSLIVAQVINRTHKQLGKTIAFKSFFANPTIEGLSKELHEDEYISIPKATEAESYPLTASQSRLWIMSQFEGGSLAYNMPGAVRLRGGVDANKFEEAFRSLIHRHEILRTSIKINTEGDIRQYIIPKDEIDFKISKEDFSLIENSNEVIASYLEEKNKEPFDLERAPLIRASLIKLKEEETVFFFSMHHIVGDGWSMELLISEVVRVYNALTHGKEAALPELGIQYKDYAVWLNGELQQEKQQASEQYWLQQFEGEIPVLELPSFKTRPLVQTYNGAYMTHHFSQAFLGKLKDFSKEQDVTLFMTLMAGINVLLYKYSGQDDIIVGTPMAGREHPDLENQIGLYLNTLAIRTRFNEGNSFADLVSAQKETLLAAYEHQSYPFDALVDKLNLERDTSRSALFDVLVSLQSQLNNLKGEELVNLEVSNYDFSNKTAQFDMGFTFVESEGLDLAVSYNTDIYDAYLIEKMFVHFENLLAQLVKQPEKLIREVGYLTEEESNQLLLEFNNTEVDYPEDKTIIDLFEEQVEKTPNNIAVVFENTELTYKELNERSNQLANYLRENYSIKADDLVGIKLDRSEIMIITILGILKSGAAYVPIDVNYPQERIDYIEKDSNCKAVIDEEEMMLYHLERFRYGNENLNRINKLYDLAYVIYTSGTTGNPKGVMIENRSLCNYLKWCSGFYFEKEEEGNFGLFSSLSFDLTVTSLFLPLIRGHKIKVFANNLNAHEVLQDYILNSNALDIIKLTPSHLEILKDLNLKEIPLKKIIVGGEALLSRQVDEILKENNELVIYNEYGPTESTVGCMIKIISKDSQITIGEPISNTQVYILDESLQPFPIGAIGTLYVSGAGLARGYLNKPELTAAKFVSNPFIEGERMYD
ncbi:amino acid adenylation domain-containing protein, partial [Flavobacterium collinsii]|uniref:amino acid adenylation domain-containing protein n=2 Tax=Flavobacterium collinsii TaxID=1114861 RepID=UPI003756E59B